MSELTVKRVDAGHRLSLLCDAARVVIKAQRASQDQIQRRIRVGFATAGMLMILLEEAGIVAGGYVTASRDVLVPRDQVDAVLAILNGDPA